MAGPRGRIAAGAGLMVVATFCFVGLDSILRVLAARHDVLFLAFIRNLFQVGYLLALLPVFGWRRILVTHHPTIQVARGAMLVGTTVFMVLGLKALPLAQTYAITFSAPLIASALAVVALGERPSARRWILIGLGFAGVLVAIRPGSPEAGWALAFPLLMASANAIYHVLTRKIANREEPLAMLFHVGFFALLFTALPLPWTWSALEPREWAWLAAGGLFGTAAHLLLILAFRLAPTAIVSPMIYMQIVAACLVGYLAFGEIPSAATLLGALIVVASGVALIRTKS